MRANDSKPFYTSGYLLKCDDGRWKARLKYTDETGRQRIKSRMMKSKSKRLATKELESWRKDEEADASKLLKLGDMAHDTISDLLNRYIDMLKASASIESSTIADYRTSARFISRGIGSVEFAKLTVPAAQDWVNGLVEEGYKPSTIRKSVTLLKAAYRDAVSRLQIIDHSPVEAIRCPKARYREPNALPPNERARLLSFLGIARECPENVGVYLALLTGMRRGELLALKWRCVDFEAKLLHVRASIGYGEDGHYEKEPKNGGSRRDIPIPDEVAGVLTRRLETAKTECYAAGVRFDPTFYVLGGPDGSFMAPERLSRHWAVTVRQLGLLGTQGQPPKFHDLRHTFATAAIAEGADIKSVSALLGHANAAMTLNIYASSDVGAKRTAMDVVAKAITSGPPNLEILKLLSTE